MRADQYLVWGLSGLSKPLVGRERRLGGVEVDMLGSIAPRVIRISQDCPKGVMEHNRCGWCDRFRTSQDLSANSCECYHNIHPCHLGEMITVPQPPQNKKMCHHGSLGNRVT